MLSIGKLGVGQADYYLQAVGQGIEDYYAGTGEAPGRWLGTAATELVLAGQVDADQLRSVLNGNRPDGFGPLTRSGQGKSRVPGFDLTFSAPKSVSLLFGLGDEHISRQTRDAHEAAVDAALEYMERHAALGRRGKGGAVSVLGNGFIGAGFRHRTSRAGDPQLHTHVLVANMTRGPDGRWTALDARRLYTHARTGGFLYQAKLRLELTRRLGVEWTPVRNGVAEVDGIPANVRRAFSRRRAEIESELQQRGEHTPGAAQVAALHTRREKDYDVPADQLREGWQSRAAQLNFTTDHVTQATRQTGVTPLTREAASVGQDRLASPEGLTRRQSSFTRRDAVRAWCEQLPHGGDVDQIEALADDLLNDGQAVVPLLPDASTPPIGDVVRRADGRLVAAGSEERCYSTPELLALEAEILDTARGGRDRDRAVVTPATASAVLAAHPELSNEQATMVDRLLQDGDAIAVVVGRAGTGKTYALAAAREGWQAESHQVIGAALARRASLELRDGAGIDATSLHALLADLRNRPGELLARPTVIVVDEAGMVGTRQLAELVQHASEHQAKLVLVGDPRQLPEIDAGGSFRALTMRGDPIVLADNRRQREHWERDALDQLRAGQAEPALARYAAHDRLTIADTAPQLRGQLVADWWTARETGADSLMIALRRDDVADLNARARAHMRHHGRLGPDALTVGGKSFAVGDQAVTLRNHPGLGVTNGTHGTITAIGKDGAVVLADRAGREYELTLDYLASTTQRGGPVLDHGYALTGHKAQGLTVDQTFVLGSDQLYREWGYVAMSRGRNANRLYLVNAHDDRDLAVAHADERKPPPLDATTRALARSAGQTSASDGALAARIAGQPTPVLQQRLTDLTRVDAASQRRGRHDRALAAREARRGGPQPRVEPTPVPSPPAERGLIADELARRRGAEVHARAVDPPRYLLEALGPVPERPTEQRTWRARAQRIEELRREVGFDDPQRALPAQVTLEHRAELAQLQAELGDPRDVEQARGIER